MLLLPKCRLCGADLTHTFVDLGMSPLCESYVPAERLDGPETFYPLHVRLCESCLLVQLPAYVSGEDIFSDYAYFSSYSDSWVAHAGRYAEAMIGRLGLTSGSLVTEVASNDGYLLQHFLARDIPVLGVEPAANVAEAARARGIRTVVQFLGAETGREIAEQYGRADLVAGNNVFAHVPDIRGFAAGLRALVKDTGLVTLEFPHLLRLIERRQYDTIYHEHFSYLSLLTSSQALATAGLRVVDVDELSTHGGSLRVYARPAEAAGEPTARVKAVLAEEEAAGLHTVAGHEGFAREVLQIKSDLLDSCSPRRRKAGRWPATAPRARGTRCSTTAASGRICSPTPSTGARGSRASSCRARISRSMRRSASPRPGPTTFSSCRGTCGRRSASSSTTSGRGAAGWSSRSQHLKSSEVGYEQ